MNDGAPTPTPKDARPPAGEALCALDALANPGARGFVFEREGFEWPFRGFVARKGETVVGYVDACPHVGAPLATEPDRYFDPKGEWLLCFQHGAMFRPEDGMCVAGPCVRRALRPWPVAVRDGTVVTI